MNMTLTAVKVRRCQDVEAPGLGAKVKDARLKDGRSAQVLATLSGISTGYWYQIEKEERQWISEEVVRSIEDVLGVKFGVSFED